MCARAAKVLALIAEGLFTPHRTNDLDGLRERGLPLACGQKRQAKVREFVGIPAITQAQNQTASGEVVEIGGQSRGQDRATIERTAHIHAQADAPGGGR